MKENIALCFAVALCLLLTGCGYRHVMVGPKGDVVDCYASGSGFRGAFMASTSVEECMEYYKAKGYREDEDQRFWYQKPDKPKSSSQRPTQESNINQDTQTTVSVETLRDWLYAGNNRKGDVTFYYDRNSLNAGNQTASVVIRMVPDKNSSAYAKMQTILKNSGITDREYDYSILLITVDCKKKLFKTSEEKSYDDRNRRIMRHRTSDWRPFEQNMYNEMIKDKLCIK
jgi:hypothetical protein